MPLSPSRSPLPALRLRCPFRFLALPKHCSFSPNQLSQIQFSGGKTQGRFREVRLFDALDLTKERACEVSRTPAGSPNLPFRSSILWRTIRRDSRRRPPSKPSQLARCENKALKSAIPHRPDVIFANPTPASPPFSEAMTLDSKAYVWQSSSP
jgi:hypothetical protein